MNFKKTSIACGVAAMSLALISCGGDSGSQDSGANSSTSFTGLVVDGRIANGTVWVDLNNNGAIDSFEPYATTDEDGYFSYRPEIDGEAAINYCNLDDSPYCLKTGTVETSATIKIAGGTDLDSGEPFYGIMSQTVTKSQAEAYASGTKVPMMSPLTSLGATLGTDNLVSLLNTLGFSSVTSSNIQDTLETDFSDRDFDDTDDASEKEALFKAAYRIQKIVDSIAVVLDAKVEDNGITLGLTSDDKAGIRSTSEYVAAALAEKMSDSDWTFSDLDATNLATVTTSAIDKFAAAFAAIDDEYTKDQVVAFFDSTVQNEVASIGAKVGETVGTALQSVTFDASNSTVTETAFKTAVIQSETVLAKAKVNKTASGVTDTATAVLNPTFKNNLNSNTSSVFDIGLLAANLTSSNAGTYDVTTAALASVKSDLWANKYLVMAGEDTSTQEKGRVMFFFDATSSSAKKGTANICYAFDAGNTGDDDEIGSIQNATWSKISDGVIQVTTAYGGFQVKAYKLVQGSSFTSTETDEFLGTPTPSSYYGKFLFTSQSFDQDEIWYSSKGGDTSDTTTADWGLTSTSGVSIPKSDAACKAFNNEALTQGLTITVSD